LLTEGKSALLNERMNVLLVEGKCTFSGTDEELLYG